MLRREVNNEIFPDDETITVWRAEREATGFVKVLETDASALTAGDTVTFQVPDGATVRYDNIRLGH